MKISELKLSNDALGIIASNLTIAYLIAEPMSEPYISNKQKYIEQSKELKVYDSTNPAFTTQFIIDVCEKILTAIK